ncbi:MAG TPA: hypothetical protein PK530_04395 [Anaerolineales bacterium]|nr:hypothetical protein [Anaerolineales bacterium]
MAHEIFTYQILKNETIRIFWEGRGVMTLGGKRAEKLASELTDANQDEVQALLQRVTGNFKRGNERQAKNKYQG